MGLLTHEDRDTLPLTVQGSAHLVPIEYVLPVPSAQVKSAILIAGLMAAGETTVVEKEPTRDHTERMLRYFGAHVENEVQNGLTRITVHGDAELEGRDVVVPGDPSSAAFLIAAALLVPGSDVTVEGVLVNETRTGLYTTLKEMGGRHHLHARTRGRRRTHRRSARAPFQAKGRPCSGRSRALDD